MNKKNLFSAIVFLGLFSFSTKDVNCMNMSIEDVFGPGKKGIQTDQPRRDHVLPPIPDIERRQGDEDNSTLHVPGLEDEHGLGGGYGSGDRSALPGAFGDRNERDTLPGVPKSGFPFNK